MDAAAEPSRPADLELQRLKRALRRERRRVHALEDISVALGSTLDLDEVLQLIVGRVTELMEADRTTLYLLDDKTEELWSKVAQGSDMLEFRLRVGEGLAGFVAQTGKVLNVENAYDDPRFNVTWDRRTGYTTRNTLCVPVRNHHGRIIGVIQVLNKIRGNFLEEDEQLLSALAAQAAVSLENSKLFLSMVEKNRQLLVTKGQLEKKIGEQDLLFQIAQVSARAFDLDDLLEGVLERAALAVGAEAGSILLADEHTGDLFFRTTLGRFSSKVDAERATKAHNYPRIRAGDGICGWVATHGEGQIVNDVHQDARYSSTIGEQLGGHPKSILCVPLRWDDGIGALEFINKVGAQETFTEEDLKLATVFAGHISSAIGLAQNRERRAQQERLSVVGQFLSSILHDLRTPMSVISGFVEMMQDESSEDRRRELAQTVVRQTQRINAMTQQTLAFVRGDRELLVQKVYLKKFFGDLAPQLELELNRYGVCLEIKLNSQGYAYLDPHKLERAIHNLARNAAEAIQGERGPSTVDIPSVSASDGNSIGVFRITVDQDEEQAVTLRFEDDGPGIPQSVRDALFQSFVTSGKTQGTGLGLAVVRSVAEDHGGTVDVESEPGKTLFTLKLKNQELQTEPDSQSPPAKAE